MQSLDSSCQEADTIINDTLLKLKGSSLQSNSSNNFRQPHFSQPQTHLQYQNLLQQQQTLQQPHSSFYQQSTSSLAGLQPLSHQPPPYLLDGPESPSEYIINEHGLLSANNSVGEVRQQISSSSTPSLLSNINSIISPPPVVPDMLLNSSPTSPSLNSLKPEKRALISPSTSATFSNNQFRNSSSPSKKPKLMPTYGEAVASSSSSSSSSSILQPLLSSSSPVGSNSNNPKYSSSLPSPSLSLSTVCYKAQQNAGNEIKLNSVDQFKSAKVVYSTSLSGSCLNQVGSGSIEASQPNAPASSNVTGVPSPAQLPTQQLQIVTNVPIGSVGSSSVGTSTTTAPSNPSAFFDIYDKIRELYLYLLIHDEKGLKESRKRHRTRSFVLERLVDREKLNTIVLNLYPGNKGYSLAFYQDDNQIEALNESTAYNASDCIRNSAILGDGGGGSAIGGCGGATLNSGGVSPSSGSSGMMKHGTNNGSSSRLKQTQIISNSVNNKNSNTVLSSKNEMVDFEMALTASSGVKSSGNAFDKDNADDSVAGQCGVAASTLDNNFDRDDDDNLVEVMSWPYEIDDLLNSIDKEELPIFISDLLEARIPNVFYSGCVICQVRDYRQTFPISSNSCDIYHVLLKPTNEMLYSDINQISIDASVSNEDKLLLESQLILATSEPLCLDPDPRIGRCAINSQHRKQLWNTSPLRRQMKKYSQISINRKRKIDQFTHHYGLELCDYLQRIRQRPRALPSSTSSGGDAVRTVGGVSNSAHILASINKLQKKSSEIVKPIRTPKFEYPPLVDPGIIDVIRLAKEFPPKSRDTREDFLPVLIEEYTLESDREYGHVYLIKLSIYKRPATMEYLGELYVDRIHRQGGEHKGESCRFSLGTRAYADRYIDQFTELFTEEGRKAVRITHRVPGQPTNISCTNGYNYQVQPGPHITQQSVEVNATSQQTTSKQQVQHQQQHHQQIPAIASTSQQQSQPSQQQQQPQPLAPNYTSNQMVAPTLNATSPSNLPGNQQLNINLHGGNIVGITAAGNVQQLRQQSQQLFDSTNGSVSVQTQPGQQISLSNGSLVLVQQQPSGSGVPTALTIQSAANNPQKAQIVSNSNQMTVVGGSIRSQMGANVPILQAQLKAGSLVPGQHQQQIIQQKVTNVSQAANPAANTYVTGFMNVPNTFQPPQQQPTQQVQVQQHTSQNKSANNAAILSLLNSAPAAMTSTPLGSAFTATGTVQQSQSMAQQTQQQHQSISAEQLLQQPPRKTNEVIQNLLTNSLRKINMANSANQPVVGQNRGTNIIAVGLPSDANANQNVRVTMSALASQLASPPALMTNSNFGFTATGTNSNNNVNLGNNNIKILNNPSQRILSGSSLRRDSLVAAVPSPGSDSNASNTSGASNLGFAMPGLNALLATSPSSGSEQSQVQSHGTLGVACGSTNIGSVTGNHATQALFERLNSNSGSNTNNSGLSPQQPANVTKNLVQNVANAQSPAASISPLSSPPPQPSPQQMQVQQTTQTTTLNLQGIDFQSLQGAMATFPGLQNVQVQIPISLPLSNTPLATASGIVSGSTQRTGQQATSLLVSVPVTNTTQVNSIQTVPGGCGTIVSAVPASGAATQTVVLTNAGNTGNSQAGSMLSLPIAQLFASVKGLNHQSLRTTTVAGGSANNVINANIIQASSANGNMNNTSGSSITGPVNISSSTGATSIQLVGTLQQRPRSIQVLGAKPIANRGQLSQRNVPNTTSKITTTTSPGPTQIPTSANLTASPVVMTTQKLQLKLQKQNASSLQQQPHAQSSHHSQQHLACQQQPQTQHIQLGGSTLTQNLATIAAANQKRRRSATDLQL